MKLASKQKAVYWGVTVQINNRPSKLSKGVAFTNERRARKNGKSTFYHVIITSQRQSNESRTLSVKGTLDKLASINSVSKYNFRRYKKGLPQQKRGANNGYLKALSKLVVI